MTIPISFNRAMPLKVTREYSTSSKTVFFLEAESSESVFLELAIGFSSNSMLTGSNNAAAKAAKLLLSSTFANCPRLKQNAAT